jgi:hypothetical protein
MKNGAVSKRRGCLGDSFFIREGREETRSEGFFFVTFASFVDKGF